MTTDASNLALIGILATVVTGLFKLLRDNTKALERVAVATEQGAQEAKERNGHLGTQTLQVAKIGRQGISMSKKILDRLERSAVTLAVETKNVATQAESVRTDLIKEV